VGTFPVRTGITSILVLYAHCTPELVLACNSISPPQSASVWLKLMESAKGLRMITGRLCMVRPLLVIEVSMLTLRPAEAQVAQPR